MMKITLTILSILITGLGCDYKYEPEWDVKDRAWENTDGQATDSPACNQENAEIYPELPCCGDLTLVITTTGKQVCRKPEKSVTTQNCLVKGQSTASNQKCCPGLEPIAVDHAFSVCGEPGTGYKPKVCMAEGETPFIDTPNCCAGLEPKQEGNHSVCRKLQ